MSDEPTAGNDARTDREEPTLDETNDTLGDHDLTRFRVDLLVAAGRLGGASGQDLRRTLADAYGVDLDEINHGRLYPNLDDLVDVGLLDRGQRDRRTNEHTLTDAGRRVLDDRAAWLSPDAGRQAVTDGGEA